MLIYRTPYIIINIMLNKNKEINKVILGYYL